MLCIITSCLQYYLFCVTPVQNVTAAEVHTRFWLFCVCAHVYVLSGVGGTGGWLVINTVYYKNIRK